MRQRRAAAPALLALATLVLASVALVAVSLTPSSADALPAFEFTGGGGKPFVFTAADLGVQHGHRGLVIDDATFNQGIARLQQAFRHPAQPGTYELVNDRILIHPGSSGYEVDPAATKRLLVRAIRGERSNLKLPVREITSPGPPTYAIVVRLEDFRLDLYRGPALYEHFDVGVGQLRYATPPGAYYIRSKAKNPVWRNPHSSWSGGMPAYIRPGPRNPLGTRAMRLDRGALVIHGTPQPWTIGHRASHGCIRMRRPDVEKLFDIVPVGTPVFIVPHT